MSMSNPERTHKANVKLLWIIIYYRHSENATHNSMDDISVRVNTAEPSTYIKIYEKAIRHLNP